ncbi:MAG: hypothetical protein AB4290_28475, partial [Spirulina sp.]
MTANIVTRNYQLLIDGLDCSQVLTHMTGGYSHYESQSGVIKIDGSLTLQRTVGWTEDLDDRTNPRWARGKEINISLADTTGTLKPAPIVGKVYIIESEYDGRNTLQIKFGCKLSLLDAYTPPGKRVCFPLGDEMTNAYILTKLLERIGITDGFIGSISGLTTVPQSKLDNGSYISLIGQICYSQGRLAYQGNDGKIHIKPINLAPSPLLSRWVGAHEVSYDRLTGAEKPCEKIIVSGIGLKAEKPRSSDNWFRWEESYSKAAAFLPNASGDIIAWRKYFSEKVLRGSPRQIHQEEFVWQPKVALLPNETDSGLSLIHASKTYSTKTYEPQGSDPCGIDEGRLKQTQQLVYIPFGLGLAEWVENNPDHGWDVVSLILFQKIVTTYFYNDSSSTNIPILEIVINTYQSTGSIIPDHEGLAIPQSLDIIKRTIQGWYQIAPNDWEERYQEWESMAVAAPEAIEAIESRGESLSASGKMALIQTKKTPDARSNSGQNHPPAPERFPADADIVEIAIVGEANLPPVAGNQFRDRERHYQVEAGLLESQQQAERIAEIEGRILWGRYKGQSFACPVFDPLFEVSPLAAMHWIETDGKEQKFLIDGATISITQRQCVFASDGIWAGLVGIQPITIPSVIDDPPTPDPENEEEEITTKPYSKVIQFCSSLAISAKFRAYPYELDLSPISITSALGINFLDLTASPPIVDVFGTGAKAGGATGRGETPTVRG